mgnify:CR=1 FL=1
MDQGDYINLIVQSVLQSMILGSILAIIILAIFLIPMAIGKRKALIYEIENADIFKYNKYGE